MASDIKLALEEAKKVCDLILKDELTRTEKDTMVADSVRNFNDHVNPGWLKYRKSVSTDATFVEWSDSGESFYDLYGQEFIDCLGGFGIYTAGHRNPEILEVVQKQLGRYALHSQELLDPLRGYLANILALATPGDLQYSFFCSSGAEAVEMALKLARLASKKKYYISTVNGFHGKTYGAVSVSGKYTYRQPYLPMIQAVAHVEFGNAQALETTIKNLNAVGESVAAFICEPIQGEAGIIIPPAGYLKQVRAICDRYGVIMIADEVQTGLGRTGYLWACEAEDVAPDILVFGKAFGGGILPITGIIASPKLWTEDIVNNPWILGSPTFGGNPLCCSAAIASLRFLLENDLPAQIRAKGAYLMGKLYTVQQKHEILIDLRGRGFLIGLEFPEPFIGWSVSKGLFQRGVMTGGTLNNVKTLRIEPPGIISYQTMDKIVAILDETLTEVEQSLRQAAAGKQCSTIQ